MSKPTNISEVHYAAGEEVIFDYTDRKPRRIWGVLLKFGDAVLLHLERDVTLSDLLAARTPHGPWSWGAFPTAFLERISERIVRIYDGSVLYASPVAERPLASDGVTADGVTADEPSADRIGLASRQPPSVSAGLPGQGPPSAQGRAQGKRGAD